MTEKIQNRDYNHWGAFVGSALGGGFAGSVTAVVGSKGLIGAVAKELPWVARVPITRLLRFNLEESSFTRLALKGDDFVHFLPRLRSVAKLGGIIGGVVGLGAEALFSFGQFRTGEISGEEYAERILWSGGLGLLGGLVSGLLSVGNPHFFRWCTMTAGDMGVREGIITYGFVSIYCPLVVGCFGGLALNDIKKSLFS